MRLHTTLSSSAALAALCSLLVVSGGCGGDGTSEGDGSGPAYYDGELRGGLPSSEVSGDSRLPAKAEAPTAGAQEDASGKVTICHVPPGNPANAHTLIVSRQGWENGHQRHRGDSLGPCGDSGEVPDDGPTDPDGDPTDPDGNPTDPEGPTEPEEPVCAPAEAACGEGVACCDGLECRDDGICRAPIIIN